MEFHLSAQPAGPPPVTLGAFAAAVVSATPSPASPTNISTPMTDTELLQLALRNAVSAAAAGKATVAANNYALVVKIFFRKCFLLEELVLLALAMGYEKRQAALEERQKADGDVKRISLTAPADGASLVLTEEEGRGASTQAPFSSSPSRSCVKAGAASQPHPEGPPSAANAEGLVDPMAHVGMLLPPGLDDGDYDEERTYYEQKIERGTAPPRRATVKIIAEPSAVTANAHTGHHHHHQMSEETEAGTQESDAQARGYDAATARWLVCLLAKVHRAALPIATLEKLCKMPIPMKSPSGSASFVVGAPSAAQSRLSMTAASSPEESTRAPYMMWPADGPTSLTSAASTSAVGRLLPHLKCSPTASPTVPPYAATAHTTNLQDFTAALFGCAASPSLSLLFATLLWDVACALWNEGFIEDAYHWLLVMDVRRLWKLYHDACAGATTTLTALREHASTTGNSTSVPANPLRSGGSSGYGYGREESPSGASPVSSAGGGAASYVSPEPVEEPMEDEKRACALSWAAVLQECTAADAPPVKKVPAERALASTEKTIVKEGQQHAPEEEERKEDASKKAVSTTNSTAERPRANRSGITLSAFVNIPGPLPMTSSHTDPSTPQDAGDATDREMEEESTEVAGRAPAQENAESLTSNAEGVAATATVLCSLPRFVRRLARRAAAMRDLCGVMVACETAEDVFYVLYAFHAALRAQQHKMEQQQQQQPRQQDPSSDAAASPSEANGALAEVLLVANLLVEFFLTKRAQTILLEEGITAGQLAGLSTLRDVPGSRPHPQRQQQQPGAQRELTRKVDRAIRRACDEIVQSFTDGQCMTLYALESYGIPAPHTRVGKEEPSTGGGGSSSSGASARLLAPELPYVLVSNVLSSTLNFATLYRLSKVFYGVMGIRCDGTTAATTSATRALIHKNHTRKATEEERQLRRQWTRPPSSAAGGERAYSPQRGHSPAAAATTYGVMDELFGLVRGAATGLRGVMDPAAGSTLDTRSATSVARAEVRSLSPSGGSSALGGASAAGYAERIAIARRAQQQQSAECGVNTSAGSGGATAASATAAAARHTYSPLLQTSGPDGCELRLPSNGSQQQRATFPSSTATTQMDGAPPLVSLLAEESEVASITASRQRTAATSDMETVTIIPSPPHQQEEEGTVLSGYTPLVQVHEPFVQLQSRSHTEAAGLRLLTILYRYPQLQTLEPVAAGHVDLVAKELNKALHLLQGAMRGRFGQRWWLHWRRHREAETQRYYARALADAQRGNSVANLSPTFDVAPECTTQESPSGPAPAFPQQQPSQQQKQQVSPAVLSSTSGSSQGRTQFPSQLTQLQGKAAAFRSPSPPPPPPAAPVLSSLWTTRPLSIPTHQQMEERRHPQCDLGETTSPSASVTYPAVSMTAVVDKVLRVPSPASLEGGGDTTTNTAAINTVVNTATVVTEDGTEVDVNWDVPPVYTPEVSLDFSAFTTSSVETQEATRQLVQRLQRQQHAADAKDVNIAGVSLLAPACRRLLHNSLPLLQQYSPWRVIYSTRMHGVSLSTLFANCRREGERGRGGLADPFAQVADSGDARPMLLVLELPASTTMEFAEDDAGVRTALEETRAAEAIAPPGRTIATVEAARHGAHDAESIEALPSAAAAGLPYNKMYIGAYLSDLLRIESRRYYGSQDCFVFQILVPADKRSHNTEKGESSATEDAAAPPPQLRVHHASRQNAQYINCRPSSIVIGGGGGGSSLYVDNTLCHAATSSCATFSSPPLSVWQAASTLCDVAGVTQPSSPCDDDGRQHSLYLLNVEVVVIDS